jgi:hypothetical protein
MLLKITSKLSKLGKEAKYIYDTLDSDKSGSCKRIFISYSIYL